MDLLDIAVNIVFVHIPKANFEISLHDINYVTVEIVFTESSWFMCCVWSQLEKFEKQRNHWSRGIFVHAGLVRTTDCILTMDEASPTVISAGL